MLRSFGRAWGVRTPSSPVKVGTSLPPNEGLENAKENQKQIQPLPEDFRREAVRRADDPNTTMAEIIKMKEQQELVQSWAIHSQIFQ